MERSRRETAALGERVAEVTPRVGLLSTGDELTNGNVLNTNSYHFAQQLFDHFIQPGVHFTVNDEQNQLEQGIQLLLNSHSALIISGGLGPTSDDRTRFALSAVIGQELVFYESSWERIVNRLQRLSLAIPDTNRQQCLFPAGAEIYPNDNGTADGCRVMHDGKPIFMLPGPPFECMPIFKHKVLPFLLENNYARPLHRYQWLLLAVSEGSIAALLDPLVINSPCQLGYRINPPYLEVKLLSHDREALELMRRQFADLIEGQSVSHHQQSASSQLLNYIIENQLLLNIIDTATGGLMMTALQTPQSFPYLHFDKQNQAGITVILSGLEDYWNGKKDDNNEIKLIVKIHQRSHSMQWKVPYRKERTLLYAMEMACWKILTLLR